MGAHVSEVEKKIILRVILVPIILGLMLFLPAGTFDYWEAWIYLGVILGPMFFIVLYFLRKDPALLERRIRMREKEEKQKIIITIADLFFFIGFLIPGLDHRYHWSEVPESLVIVSDAFIFLGYMAFFWVLRENSYASRIIEVEKGQRVVTTGPYAIVRHPMYLAVLVILLFTPLALGSFWALIFFLPLPPLIIFRLLNEEEVLSRELPGYREYCQRTPYRLFPFIW